MKKPAVWFLGTFFLLTGCAALKENQVLTEIAVGQVVSRHIEESGDHLRRAKDYINLASKIEGYLSSGAVVSSDTFVDALYGYLGESSLSPSDKLLLGDLLTLAESGLKDIEIKKLPEAESVAFIKSLAAKVRRTAQLYL